MRYQGAGSGSDGTTEEAMEKSATKGNPSTPTARRISGFTAKFLMVMFLITFVIVAVIGTAATLITLSRLHVGKICIEANWVHHRYGRKDE
jgi:hypothetical protein